MQKLKTGGTIKALKPNRFHPSHGEINRRRFLVTSSWRKGARESRTGRGGESCNCLDSAEEDEQRRVGKRKKQEQK